MFVLVFNRFFCFLLFFWGDDSSFFACKPLEILFILGPYEEAFTRPLRGVEFLGKSKVLCFRQVTFALQGPIFGFFVVFADAKCFLLLFLALFLFFFVFFWGVS